MSGLKVGKLSLFCNFSTSAWPNYQLLLSTNNTAGFFINKVFIVYFYRKKKCFNHHTLQALHLPVQRIILIQKHCNIWFNGMEDGIHSGEEARLEDEASHHNISLVLTRQELPDWEQSHVLQNSVNLQNIQFYLCLFQNLYFGIFLPIQTHRTASELWWFLKPVPRQLWEVSGSLSKWLPSNEMSSLLFLIRTAPGETRGFPNASESHTMVLQCDYSRSLRKQYLRL